MLALSKTFLGLPYTWGGTSSYGYDCSGFTQMLERRRGVIMPRDAQPQADWSGVVPVERKDLQPGDLLYFGSSRQAHHPHRHVPGRRQVHQRHHLRDPHGPHRRSERPALDALLVAMQESEVNRRDFVKAAGRRARCRARLPRRAAGGPASRPKSCA